MNQKTFSIVAGVIFALVALFHLVRIYMDWPVMIGGWSVLSWIGLVVAGGLAFFGLKLAERAMHAETSRAASVWRPRGLVILSRGLEFATIPVAKTFSWCSPSGSSCMTSIRALWTH
jgi:hypothetical protein